MKSHLSVLAVLLSGMAVLPLGCAQPSQQPATGDSAVVKGNTGASLQSWNDGAAKEAIIEFVARVTDPTSPDFVPEPERIACPCYKPHPPRRFMHLHRP